MGYCFMTIEKIKDKGTMTRKYEHNYRTGYVPNADESKKNLNEELLSLNGKTYNEAFEDKMEKLKETNPKIRKNAVLGLEIVTTFSREDKEQIDLNKWKEDQVKWLEETFNENKEYGNNVISVMFHGDEAGNVHCHSIVIPIDDKGHLNASHYLDGRKKMVELQDSYGALMSENHGLRRGLKGSSAKHEDIKRFYSAANMALAKEGPEILKINGRNETAEEYKKRSDQVIKDLNLRILAEQKKKERAIAEVKTMDLSEKFKLYKEVELAKKIIQVDDDEDVDIKTVFSKAKTMDVLNRGIQNYPDKEVAMDAFNKIQEIVKFQEEEDRKRRLEEEKMKKKKKKDRNIK